MNNMIDEFPAYLFAQFFVCSERSLPGFISSFLLLIVSDDGKGTGPKRLLYDEIIVTDAVFIKPLDLYVN